MRSQSTTLSPHLIPHSAVRSPRLTVHSSPFTAHRSQLTTLTIPLTTLPLTTHSRERKDPARREQLQEDDRERKRVERADRWMVLVPCAHPNLQPRCSGEGLPTSLLRLYDDVGRAWAQAQAKEDAEENSDVVTLIVNLCCASLISKSNSCAG